MERLFEMIERTGAEGIYGLIVFGAARPLGLIFGFQAFAWAIGQAVLLRTGIAIAIGLPTLVINLPELAPIVAEASPLASALIAPREFAIGFGLGLLASLPFLALQYAGAVTDSFRGESDGGQPDPAGGGQLQTFSALYVVVGFAVFFSLGGLWQLVGLLYQSYAIWPIEAALPTLANGGASLAIALLGETLATSVRIALPLLGLLFVVEIAVAAAARLGRRTGFYELAFPAKNLATVLVLPLVGWFIASTAETLTLEAFVAGDLLARIVPAPQGEGP
ncbi:MAG: flagellar biosynthetic protein FliR [Pseudomonadota bacterium]